MPSKKISVERLEAIYMAGQADQVQPPPENKAPAVLPLFCYFTDLGQARRLPIAPPDHALALGYVQFGPGTIEQFADEDGATMRIVNVGGVAHKAPAPVVDQPPEAEGA